MYTKFIRQLVFYFKENCICTYLYRLQVSIKYFKYNNYLFKYNNKFLNF